MEPDRPAPPDAGPVLLPAALCCASAVGLLVVLPRLFSGQAGFLAVSLALLGLPGAGVLVARRGPLRLRSACALAALAVPLAAALAVRVPLDVQDLGALRSTLSAPALLLLVGALGALPFLALGLGACSALQWRHERPGALGGACFLGGAAGAGLALAALDAWGAPVALLLLAVPPLVGALLPSRVPPAPGVMACALAAAALTGAGLRASDDLLPLPSREPVTDNQPFLVEHGQPGEQELLVAALVILLALSAPLLIAAPRPAGAAGFVALGLGQALVAVAFMQRFTLLLGDPVHAMTVVLAALLVFSGCGSLLSSRAPTARAQLAALVAAAAIVVAALGANALDATLVGAPFAARVAGVAALLSLPGLATGLPFPLAVRGVAGERAAGAFLWSGVAAVLAAPLAILLAMQAGLLVTLCAGAACCVVAAAFLRA